MPLWIQISVIACISFLLIVVINFIATDNSNAEYDHTENIELVGRAIYGSYEDVFVWNDTAYLCQGSSLTIVDISQKENPNILCHYDIFITATIEVFIDGDYAYVTAGYGGLYIINIRDGNNPFVVGRATHRDFYTSVYVKDDYAFVAAGYDGFLIIDISDKENPVETSTIIVATEDQPYRVFIQEDYAFLAHGWDGMRILNITNKYDPYEVGYFQVDGSANSVSVSGNHAYIGDEINMNEHYFIILDIQDKGNPIEVGRDNDVSVKDIIIVDNLAYVGDFYDGVYIIDISDKSNPEKVGYYDSTHSGITGACAYGIDVVDGILYVANSFSVGFHIIDVSDETDPQLIGFLLGGGRALDVYVEGEYVFIADGNCGLKIVDISNKKQPVEVGVFKDDHNANDVNVFEEYAYLACNDRMFLIIDISNKENPIQSGSYETTNPVYGLDVAGNYAYLAVNNDGMHIVDISDKGNPELIGYFSCSGASDVVTIGDYAYLADSDGSMRIINIVNKRLPYEVGLYSGPISVIDMFVEDNYAYVAAGNDGVRIVDISDKSNPEEVGIFQTERTVSSTHIVGNLAFISESRNGVRIINVSDKTNPIEIGYFDTAINANGLFAIDNYIFLSDDWDGFYLLEYLKNSPPNLSITSHSNNEQVSEISTIQGTASDYDGDDQIAHVDISIDYDDWQIVTGTNSWTYEWDTTTAENGEHTLRFRAYDGELYSDIQELVLDVQNNHPPNITIISHEDNDEVSDRITIRGESSDVDGNETIEYVEISVDDGNWNEVEGITSWNYEWDTTAVSNGEHAIEFRAFDGEDHSDIVVLTLNVQNDNAIPEVTIDSPYDDAEVDGLITISGTATDEDGDETIDKVEISVDGSGWETASGTTSWSYDWDTNLHTDGSYTIEVRAYDGTGYSAIEAIAITVKNTHENIKPEVTILSPLPNTEVSKEVFFTGHAADEDGEVEKVEVSIDSGSWIQVTGKNVWAYTWGTITEENGVHTASVRSYDGENYSDEVSISLTVNNEDDKDEDDEWYNETTNQGGIVAVLIILVVAIVILFTRKQDTDYYDDWGDEEDADEEW